MPDPLTNPIQLTLNPVKLMCNDSKEKKHNSYIIYHTVNGNWGTWTSYGACSVTCGVGTQQRTRSCDNPAPSGGGTTCPGDALEARTCFDVTCYPSILGSLERVCNTMESSLKSPASIHV